MVGTAVAGAGLGLAIGVWTGLFLLGSEVLSGVKVFAVRDGGRCDSFLMLELFDAKKLVINIRSAIALSVIKAAIVRYGTTLSFFPEDNLGLDIDSNVVKVPKVVLMNFLFPNNLIALMLNCLYLVS